MLMRVRLLIGVLSIMLLAAMWPTSARVWAQLPTKTPIGAPPTKAPLLNQPPTKTPVSQGQPTQPPVSNETATPIPTNTPRPTSTATPPPTLPPSATASPTSPPSLIPTTAPIDTAFTPMALVPASFTPTSPPTAMSAVVSTASTPVLMLSAYPSGGTESPVSVIDPAWPLITQALNLGGVLLGLTILGFFIWFGLSRVGRAITSEIRTVSLATLRLQHEAERLDRREKVVFRADADVLALLEQAILDASGESVPVRLLPNGWLASPPMMAVVDADQTRYIFSPTPPDQVQDIARRHGLTQLLLGRATDLTAYPIDALNSTPFIVDDLSVAFGYVLARHQAPRRPLPRTDRWYLYIARPRTSRWPQWLDRRVRQTGMLRRFTDQIPTRTRSESTREHPTTPSGPPTA